MRSALILGGTGQIGIAIARRLMLMGWSVTTTSRSNSNTRVDVPHKIADASKSQDLKIVLNKPTDLVVSCVAFSEQDSRILLREQLNIGRIVAISSASVYIDSKGRTLDEALDVGFPVFDGSISEESETVKPGPQTYSTRKIAMERELLEQESVPVNILRPCAVHGPYSSHAREWWFVKRLLDGRARIPLAYQGKSQFQTTSVESIADAVVLAADSELPRIVNVCDADSPTVMEIGQAIVQCLDLKAELIGLNSNLYPPISGATPWSIPRKFTLSSVSPGKHSYAETVRPTVEWLKRDVNDSNWKELLPQLAGYPYDHFDYSLDDAVI